MQNAYYAARPVLAARGSERLENISPGTELRPRTPCVAFHRRGGKSTARNKYRRFHYRSKECEFAGRNPLVFSLHAAVSVKVWTLKAI
jgi:hypothetical protein